MKKGKRGRCQRTSSHRNLLKDKKRYTLQMLVTALILSLNISAAVVNSEQGLQQDLQFDDKNYLEIRPARSHTNQFISPNHHLRHEQDEAISKKSRLKKAWEGEAFNTKGVNGDERMEQDEIKQTIPLSSHRINFVEYGPKKKKKKQLNINTTRQFQIKRNLLHEQEQVGSTFEWVPSTYPNPIKSPDLCHIPEKFWKTTGTNTVANPSSPDNEREHQNLFLCDPDQTLSNVDLESIGNALVNFSTHYASDSIGCHKSRDNYNIAVEEDWKEPDKMTGTAFDIDFNEEGKVSSLGGSFFSTASESDGSKIRVEIGVAVTEKLDITAILHEFRFYTFEDIDSMTDDAAQFFASYLHNQWFSNNRSNIKAAPLPENCKTSMDGLNGILIFLSVEDRVCFISSGNSVSSVLPWWRLERVVNGMKENLRTMNYSDAIIGAITDISQMVNNGPPTITEKLHDFCDRFGLVFLFSICTFILAVCGEVRERRRRYYFAEVSSRLTDAEEKKARLLQQAYRTDSCPICLEEFDTHNNDKDYPNKEFDSYGIPLRGSDGKPLKMLRCGHIFDTTCWSAWVHSGNGNPYCCPVCRQNVSTLNREASGEEEETTAPLIEGAANNQTYGVVAAPPEGNDFVNDDAVSIL